MGLRINQNIAAIHAYRNLSVTEGQMAKSLEKLSSGFRINRAADDTASTNRAVENCLERTISYLSVAAENLSASESRIRDTDMAQEMVSFTRSQTLTQAGTAMPAQANQAPQQVLQLLRG